jgi:3-methylcrotonyl-CoA carboxylase alpha subunit
MEMNTRLQVEHPVTEMITGHDLVEWQLRVAAGQPLPVGQDALRIDGHAIEVRVYAENADKGFLPSTGQLRHLRTPEAVAFTHRAGGQTAAVRIDSGVREGDAITPFYDPMIAKLITWAPDREGAIARMDAALARVEAVGLHTNVGFLRRLMRCASFAGADLDTGLIERERAALLPARRPPAAREIALACGLMLAREQAAASAAPDAHDPWQQRDGWRLGERLERSLSFTAGAETVSAGVAYAAGGYTVRIGDEALCLAALRWDDRARRLSGLLGSEAFDSGAVTDGETIHLFTPGGQISLGWRDALAAAGDAVESGGGLAAPMPGKVVAVLVAAGDKVSRGQPLVVMEAMKMEHTITAPADGEVAEVRHGVGEQVAEGAALIALR